MSGEILEVKVKADDYKALYKDKCETTNQKKINRIFHLLRQKFGIYPKKEKEETWFDD